MKNLLWVPVIVMFIFLSCREERERHTALKPPFNMLELYKTKGKVKSELLYEYNGADTSDGKTCYTYFEYDTNGLYIIERGENFNKDFPELFTNFTTIKNEWDEHTVTSFRYVDGILENKTLYKIDGNVSSYEIIDTAEHTIAVGSTEYDDNGNYSSSEVKMFSEISEMTIHKKTTAHNSNNIATHTTIDQLTGDTNIYKIITVEKDKYGNTTKEYSISRNNDTMLSTITYTYYE